jgi:hypothetical protein
LSSTLQQIDDEENVLNESNANDDDSEREIEMDFDEELHVNVEDDDGSIQSWATGSAFFQDSSKRLRTTISDAHKTAVNAKQKRKNKRKQQMKRHPLANNTTANGSSANRIAEMLEQLDANHSLVWKGKQTIVILDFIYKKVHDDR